MSSTSAISSLLGQISLKNTLFPSFPVPTGSLSKLMSTWNHQKDVTIEIKQ
jgi:hypothetical protein